MSKLFWKISPAPTGRYKAFQTRGWPSAYNDKKEEAIVANIVCEDDYVPANVKSGCHKPLTVRVAIKNGNSFDWKRLKGEFKTLAEAKAAVEAVYAKHFDIFNGSK